MKIYSTKFKGLKIIKLKKFNDFRGDIVKIFNKENNKINFKFSESYISISKKGTIRGLHGQMGKYSQSKIIFCIQGKFLDIAIDLRKSSTTYKKIFKRIVHSKNSTILVIPEGFAHGIISLEDQTILINFNSKKYKPNKEFGININSLNLKLPKIKFHHTKKDKKLPKLNEFLKENK